MMLQLEILGFVTTLWCIYLTIKENIIAWPVGIISNVVFFLIFYQNHLYGETTLQFIFILQSIYGWVSWGNKKDVAVIHEISFNKFAFHIIQIVFFTLFFSYSSNSLGFLDMFTSVGSVFATYYLVKKIFQAWILWILIDILLIILFLTKGLYI